MQKLQVQPPVSLDGEDDVITAEEVALAAFQGLLSSGKFESIHAAAMQAWVEAVPAFFIAMNEYPTMMEKIYGKGEG